MDFQLTADQEDIRDGIRKLCAGRFPIAFVRGLEGVGFDASMWAALDEAGVFGLRQMGLGLADAAVVFSELGRALIPGPLVWSHLAGGGVVGGVVDGMVTHVESLETVIRLTDEGAFAVPAAAVDATAVVSLDPLTPAARVTAIPDGERIGDAARWRLEGAVLVAAQLAGMAGALVDLTVAYTKERRQFGRPVGSFQALKHTMADMLTRAELARVQAFAAAVRVDEGSPDAARAVSSAKVIAGDAVLRNGADSLQCHGGMGYTWEIDSHLYLKRGWMLDPLFGSADEHAIALAGRSG